MWVATSNPSSKSQILLLYKLPHMLLETFPETNLLYSTLVFRNTKPYKKVYIAHISKLTNLGTRLLCSVAYQISTWLPLKYNSATQGLVRLLSGHCTSCVEVLQRTGFCDTSPVQIEHHQRRKPQIHHSWNIRGRREREQLHTWFPQVLPAPVGHSHTSVTHSCSTEVEFWQLGEPVQCSL